MQQPFSSPSFDQHPASVGMVRKRTFQDSQSGVSSSPGYSACDSSPSSAAFTDYQYLSSPHTSISTLASSPMSRNASTQSCFSTFSPHDYDIDNSPQSSLYAPFPCFSPTQDSLLADFAERPGMKRRKTMPDVSHLSPSSPVKSRDVASPFTPRGSGKDGEDVWPQIVEEHFQTALRLLPRLGRKKLIIQGKPCGRNELIADYILRHTGKVRSRKQVSSHIQVLKNLRKDDEEFMYLVSDPVEGEDQFLPGNAELFFGKNGMASPFAPPVFLERSLSASNIPHHPPIDLSSDSSRLDPAFAHPPHSHLHPNLPSPQSLHSPFIMQPSPSSATTPTSGITRGMQGMSVAVPRSPGAIPAACPIAPSFMNMIAPTTNGENGHIYARLDAPSGPTRSTYLEDLPLWDKRYARIPAMNDHLPCQFLHVNLPLSIPGVNGAALDQPLQTQLRVTSVQALPLTAVTSIYCHGDSVITYEDTLNPIPLDASSTHPLGHQHFYDVPFGSDFWTMLLRGGHDGMSEASLRKSTKDRQGLADMLPGFSVIQEFVVPSENGVSPAPGDENSLSPGSSMGDVVLVVLYDLEVSRGSRAQSGELSFVSVRRTSAQSPPTSHSMQLPNPHSLPLPLPIHDFDSYSLPTVPNVPQLIVPSHYTHHDDSLETARPHSISPHKPNLSLHIPPPSQFTRPNPQSNLSSSQPSPSNLPNGPITPWGQVVHTPTHPPPVAPPQSAQADAQRDRSRLEAAWRANAANTNNRWDLDSPALYPPPHPNLYGNAQVQAHSGPSDSSSSLSSFSMDRRSVSTPVLSMSSHQSRPTNLLPPLPSPSTLAQNFATSSSSFSPSPLSFAPQQTDYLNSKPIQRREEPRVVPTTIEREKKPVASKLEQDAFFSNLLGSTTRYTVTS